MADILTQNYFEYKKVKKNLVRGKGLFFELRKGSSCSLHKGSFKVARLGVKNGLDFSPLTKKQFTVFLASFRRHFYSRMRSVEGLIGLRVCVKDGSFIRDKNVSAWNEVSLGSYFYCIDLNSAYWQSAYKLGYISEKMFLNYDSSQVEYKSAKRLCFSFLSRNAKADYYLGSDFLYSVSCEDSEFVFAFDNIRNYLQNIIYELVRCVGFEYLEYTIDSVFVRSDKVDVVKAKLRELGLEFKIIQCKKTNDTDYFYGSKLKQFIKN